MIPELNSDPVDKWGDWNPFASLSYSTREIPDLVDWLLHQSNAAWPTPFPDGDRTVIPCKEREVFDQLIKAAYLLRQYYRSTPPEPVFIADRLPGPDDCDEQGRCWVRRRDDPGGDRRSKAVWRLEALDRGLGGDMPLWYSVWLPYNALPIGGN